MMMPALAASLLFDALDQNAVVQRSHLHGCCLLIEIHVLVFEIQLGDLPGVSSWSSDNYWITHRLARKVGLFTNLAFS
jgi:hypothetical protein